MMKNNLRLNTTIIEDAPIQASMQHWVKMECNQLSAGNIVGEIDILELDSLKLVRESQIATVQKIGVTSQNFCSLSYCTLDPKFRFTEQTKNAADTLFFLPELIEYDILVPVGVQTTYVALDQKTFIDNARILNPKQWEHPPKSLVALENEHQPIFKKTLEMWFKIAEESSAIDLSLKQSFLKKHLVDYLLQTITSSNIDLRPSYTERLSSFQTYHTARTYIEDQLNINITPTIVSICKSAGVSERTLQYAFRTHVNMSPTAYLRLRRLNRVRVILQKSSPQETTVTHIAMRFDFLHLGRFALDYKRIFHESPSVTFNN
ncbi:helix-turn-helix domain-containing protein [Paraglaciecola sp.]|uniref:helix-turn-helix domain-containing protein n=1 Tax=Paraglaciecola sp. TaxID=1920173 RepID=UPI0030F42140